MTDAEKRVIQAAIDACDMKDTAHDLDFLTYLNEAVEALKEERLSDGS